MAALQRVWMCPGWGWRDTTLYQRWFRRIQVRDGGEGGRYGECRLEGYRVPTRQLPVNACELVTEPEVKVLLNFIFYVRLGIHDRRDWRTRLLGDELKGRPNDGWLSRRCI
jgi:hypothetical protein